MFRAVTMLLALALSPSVAAAQQCTSNARQVVNELYRHMLERGADAGSNAWVAHLERGGTVREVVRAIATSDEHQQRFWRAENGEDTPYVRAVGTMYRHILGRQPDDAGARAWAAQAGRTGMDSIADRIITSPEYSQQFGDWGVPGSGGLRYCGTNNQSANQVDQRRFGRANEARTTRRSQRFDTLDVNNNGRIEPREWNGTVAAFNRLDVNNDNVLSDSEFIDNQAAAVDGFGPVGTSGEFVRVDANQPWTDTGVTVRAGDTINFDAQGTVRFSNNRNDIAGAGGTLSNRREASAPLPNQAAGALIARIGNSRALFIGNRQSVRAPFSGRLYLGVNDDYLDDNSGDFQVAVSVER